MPRTLEQFHRDVISGNARGISASLLRAGLRAAEPFYALTTTVRNRRFDRNRNASHQAPRPVISVGNITTGGTGKTPVVRWLVDRLRANGHTPAILTRGYKSKPGEDSDEQRMLRSYLPGTVVEANPNRTEAAGRVIAANPAVDLFVLDDGFQHRRLRRDFDLVLIDASNPFGFDHVLPRGLLREPIGGLSRANAFLITHIELADQYQLKRIESILRQHNAQAPIYHARHVQAGLREADGARIPMRELSNKKVFCFCGIGNPAGFESQLRLAGAQIAGLKRFTDHYHYLPDDLTDVSNRARVAGAELLITTEKDWVKLERMLGTVPNTITVWRTELAIHFEEDDEQKLLEQLGRSLNMKKETNSVRPK